MNIQRNNVRRSLGITSGSKLSTREKEIADAWENADPEFLAECKKLGIEPDLGRGQRGPICHDETPDPFATISAPEPKEPAGTIWVKVDPDGTETVFDSMEETFKANSDKINEMAQRLAFTMAADMVRDALELMTRSKLDGLTRSAETLILATKTRSSMDHQIQAELARKYGVTRAAINKDVSYIRENRTFGPLAEHMFSSPAVREECSKHTNKSHAENKRLCAEPPANSIAGMVAEILKTA
jgi:hypothetical protein